MVVSTGKATRMRAVRVALAARTGDALAELEARQELAAFRAETALRDILGRAPTLNVTQAERLHDVIAEHAAGVPVPVRFG